MKYCAIAILIFILFGYSASKVSAAGVMFQDDFSSDCLSHWEVVRNQQLHDPIQPCLINDQTAHWQLTAHQLEMHILGPQCTSEIFPRFVDLTTIRDYQMDVDIKLIGTVYADRYILFSWHDEKNWYDIHLFAQSVSVEKVINNSYETLENSFRYPLEPDETYHFTVQFKGQHEIILRINDQTALDFYDSSGTFIGFKTVGLQAGVFSDPASDTAFDNFKITSLDLGTELGIPVLKQSDPLWGGEEYDNAKNWATKTDISTWGCSLTSMVMILRYYGIFFLPNNIFLTPSSLNTWLKSQPDGYIGEGALNWLAVTRLTKQLYDIFQTPKLEFHRVPGDLDLAKTEIQHQRPVIISIPGHFLIGDGVTGDEQDILIKDPDFPYTVFSQHQTAPLAIETFIPSFTDLSYFLLVHKPGLSVHLFNSNGKELEEFQEFREHIQTATNSFPSSISSPILAEHLLAKPSDGTYVLQVSAESSGSYTFQFLTYDQLGTYTDLSQNLYLTQEPKYFFVTYSKNQPATISETKDFTSFRTDLKVARDTHAIAVEHAFSALDSEAELGELSGVSRQKRYVLQLIALLHTFFKEITPEASNILENDLNHISTRLNGIISR